MEGRGNLVVSSPPAFCFTRSSFHYLKLLACSGIRPLNSWRTRNNRHRFGELRSVAHYCLCGSGDVAFRVQILCHARTLVLLVKGSCGLGRRLGRLHFLALVAWWPPQ